MASFEPVSPTLTDEEFRLLGELVYRHCGIVVREEARSAMERRLRSRLESLGLPTFSAYHRYLLDDRQKESELERAVELLSTHETYFFREPLQLTSFQQELLPELARRNQPHRCLRLWSAGCSTGEEAYTLAMVVLDSGLFAGWDVQVHGTDISRRALASARRGEYGPSALRALPPQWGMRYFEHGQGDRRQVCEEVRRLVRFGHFNLLKDARGRLLPTMDAIFCRNVMIYFDLPARRRLVQTLYEQLAAGGFLLLGHAEHLFSMSIDFELVSLQHDLAYRKPHLPTDEAR